MAIGSGPYIFIIIVAQFFCLSWAMFIAGRSGVFYKIQVILVIFISLLCIALTVMEVPEITWISIGQLALFMITCFIIYYFHSKILKG